MTFVTNDGDEQAPTPAAAPARGTGMKGRVRGGRGGKTAAQKRKEKLADFAAPIIDTLPIKYREEPVYYLVVARYTPLLH
jgi:hypothetical protein